MSPSLTHFETARIKSDDRITNCDVTFEIFQQNFSLHFRFITFQCLLIAAINVKRKFYDPANALTQICQIVEIRLDIAQYHKTLLLPLSVLSVRSVET